MPTQKDIQLHSFHSLISLITDAAAKRDLPYVMWNWGRAHSYATCLRSCGVISQEEAAELHSVACAAKGDWVLPSVLSEGVNTFSFRAECGYYMGRFISAVEAQGHAIHSVVRPDGKGFPDVDVEIRTDANLEQLQEALRSVEDARVMLQTLRQIPLAENSLQRDYDIR
ncbi:hypothetical protein ACMSIO_20400 [Pseudomonas benzopyrenica]|uniref:hypothetical protein n=1 Tax=Pseudomonas benzopyrenica TaxID=2993566 RepID=UPI0039C0AC79